MDNNKTGKLIASLRKKKGLTQQELGDKVGVGFRAVSKWERGLTSPDITIVNELSKILGISSDELLSGNISKEHKEPKKKMSFKIKIALSIIVSLVIIITSIIAYYNDKTYVYKIDTIDDIYHIEGYATFNKNKINIIINQLEIKDKQTNILKFANYDYQIITNEEVIISYGYSPEMYIEEKIQTIGDFLNEFRLNYNGKINTSRKDVLKNHIVIKLEFITEDNQTIKKDVEFELTKPNKK